MADVDGVLLDIDDTLVDTRASFRTAVRHVVRTWLAHLPEDRHEEAVAHWVQDRHGSFGAYTRGELSLSGQRRRRAEDLHAAFGGPVLDDEGFERWEEGYEDAFRAAWAASPDAVALLDVLDARGLPYGALTNMVAGYQRDKLAAVGLGRVDVLGSMDDLGRGKPDPELFHLACRRLGTAPGRTAYVGDELDVDARGARDAGLLGIWLDRHGSGRTPDDVPVARTLADVPGLLGLSAASRFGASGPAR